jgi:hypothetical protein
MLHVEVKGLQNKMAALPVSIEADRDYRDALLMLAKQKRTTVAQLVRAATDAMYGDELADHVAYFVASNGTRKPQLEPNRKAAVK